MPRIANKEPQRIHRHHVDDSKGIDVPRAAVVSNVPTAQLVGHLPKVEKLDVEKIAKKKDADIKGVTGVRLVAQEATGVSEPSGIAHLPDGELLAVGDEKGIYVLRTDGDAQRLARDTDDCEGICTDPSGKHVYAIQESSGRVFTYDVKRDGGQLSLELAGKSKPLPKMKDVPNKGWEGVTFLSKEQSGMKTDCLVCVHEAFPRQIGIFPLPDLKNGELLRLPKRAKDHLPDLADVAVDPKTGHLFVISDEGHSVVEMVIKREKQKAGNSLIDKVELAVVSTFEIPVKRDAKTEGVCFDTHGRLWVSCDGTGDAFVFELDRG